MATLLIFNPVRIAAVEGQEPSGEPDLSLQVQNQPLGEVLHYITRDTGYTFELNDQWKGHRVNASFQNLPLEKGIKKILAGLNHALIFSSDKRIKIIVYGRAASSNTRAAPMRSYPPPAPAQVPESSAVREASAEDEEDLTQSEEDIEESEASEDLEEEIDEESETSEGQEENQDAGGESEASNQSIE